MAIAIERLYIQHDYERSENAGAGGMFQVISIRCELENGREETLTKFESGQHYVSNHAVISDLIKNYPEFCFNNTEIINDD